jgi:hypothetical protein
MTGLDNPRGLASGPEGALYVAEAGRAGPAGGNSLLDVGERRRVDDRDVPEAARAFWPA